MQLDEAFKRIEKYCRKVSKSGYQPWIKVNQLAKFSRRTLIQSPITDRFHHLLSDGESNLFGIEESIPLTTNLFEQFPLLDILKCIQIANRLNIRYPTDKNENAVVMSTDLVIQRFDPVTGKEYRVAKTFKYHHQLNASYGHPRRVKRNMEKLAIEKLYWESLGVPYVVETEISAPAIKARNLAWARAGYFHRHRFEKDLDAFVAHLLDNYIHHPTASVNTLIDRSATCCNLDWDSAFLAFQYAVWTHRLPIDHSYVLIPRNALRLLTDDQRIKGVH